MSQHKSFNKCLLGKCSCCDKNTLIPLRKGKFEKFKKENELPSEIHYPVSWWSKHISNETVLVMVWIYVKLMDRPPSHGFQHAMNVWEYAMNIVHRLPEETFYMCGKETKDFKKLVELCALIHDVNDHKYKDHLKIGVISKMISTVYSKGFVKEHMDMIFKIIPSISYTTEKRGLAKYLPYFYQIVRDVVSDADKLTAVGTEGIKRCALYTIEKNEGEKEISKLCALVMKHYNEKLSILCPHYIRTLPGRMMAIEKQKEMDKIIREERLTTLIKNILNEKPKKDTIVKGVRESLQKNPGKEVTILFESDCV